MKFFILLSFCCFGSFIHCQDMNNYEGDESDPVGSSVPVYRQQYSSIVTRNIGEFFEIDCGLDYTKIDSSERFTRNWWKYGDNGYPQEILPKDDLNDVYSTLINDGNDQKLRLTINNIKTTDARDYFCDVTSMTNYYRVHVRLIVKDDDIKTQPRRSPKIDIPDEETEVPYVRSNIRDNAWISSVNVGDSFNASCSILFDTAERIHFDTEEMKWWSTKDFLRGREITPYDNGVQERVWTNATENDTSRDLRLFIDPVEKTDAGYYVCSAKDATNEDVALLHMKLIVL